MLRIPQFVITSTSLAVVALSGADGAEGVFGVTSEASPLENDVLVRHEAFLGSFDRHPRHISQILALSALMVVLAVSFVVVQCYSYLSRPKQSNFGMGKRKLSENADNTDKDPCSVSFS